MHPSTPSRQLALTAPFLPPLAALSAIVAFAGQQADPQAAAETAYLGLLAAASLLAVAALEAAPGPLAAAWNRGRLTATAAVLVVLAVWALPAGPLRGGVVMTLGVAALTVAAGRRLAGSRATSPAFAPLFAVLLPLALAVQVLVRCERLLAPEPGWRLFAGLFGLPVVAAAAAAFLVVRGGRAPALAATATAALLGPGFTVTSTGALVLLAAAGAAWAAREDAPRLPRERWIAATAATAVVVGLGVVEPAAGVAAALVALVVGGRWPSFAVGAVALAAIATLPGVAGWRDQVTEAAMTVAPLAFVLGLAALTRETRRWAWAAVALVLLAVAVAHAGGGLSALAVPLAALPLVTGRSLVGRSQADRHALFAPQAVWSVILLAITVLLAAYPWLRARPLAAALAVFGLSPGGLEWLLVAVAALAAAGLAAIGRWWAPGRVVPAGMEGVVPTGGSPRRVAAWAVALLVAGAVAAHPSPRRVVLLSQSFALDAGQPRLELELPAAVGSSAGGRLVIVLDSSLSHSAAVAAAAPVATFDLAVADGPSLAGDGTGWTVRAGDDTAEWAIRRPDVVALVAHPSPPAWLARATDQGFFGLTFRSHGLLPVAASPARLVIERHASLPPETIVHLHRIEIRR